MGDKFRFKFDYDLFFYINDTQALRFIGNGNSPYTHLPLTFWMLERQLKGNNCFQDYKSLCDSETVKEIRREYDDKFYFLNKYIVPEMIKLPTNEKQFNKILGDCGLSLLADMNPGRTNISIENKLSIVRREVPKQYEIHRFDAEDICAINTAYKSCMINNQDLHRDFITVALAIYECIAQDVNSALTK